MAFPSLLAFLLSVRLVDALPIQYISQHEFGLVSSTEVLAGFYFYVTLSIILPFYFSLLFVLTHSKCTSFFCLPLHSFVSLLHLDILLYCPFPPFYPFHIFMSFFPLSIFPNFFFFIILCLSLLFLFFPICFFFFFFTSFSVFYTFSFYFVADF